MEIWNKLINDGDRLHKQNQYEKAKEKYLRAVERSRFLYSNCSKKDEAINTIINSHNQLLECLIANFQYEFAGYVILQSYKVITHILSTIEVNTSLYEHTESLHKQLKARIFELLTLYPEIEICDDCQSNIFGYPVGYKKAKLYTIN